MVSHIHLAQIQVQIVHLVLCIWIFWVVLLVVLVELSKHWFPREGLFQ